jgi:hypothetical protein
VNVEIAKKEEGEEEEKEEEEVACECKIAKEAAAAV